jgi:hypothetical protein
MPRDFEELIAEGERAPVAGWGFSFLDGRATEARPPWRYADSLVERVRRARSLLDLETGGGEVLAFVLGRAGVPERVVATEPYPPNRELAHRTLGPFGVDVLDVAPGGNFPVESSTIELVCARHPVGTYWDEAARVLVRGGTFFAQLVGSGTNSELREFMTGRPPKVTSMDLDGDAASSGLEVLQVRDANLEVEFYDVAAVVYFLRKVVWTVPDFSVARYRDRLLELHRLIESEGRFRSHSRRVLLEARKPL